MSSWKYWRKRRYGPVITEHEKEYPKWKLASRIIFERMMNYPTSRLLAIAGFGAAGLVLLYYQGMQWGQRRLHRSPYTVLAIETFQAQKKLVSLVGEPFKFGWIFAGQKDSIQKDWVDIAIPVYGSRSEGILFVEAHKTADSWILDDLCFEFLDEAGGVVQIVKSAS